MQKYELLKNDTVQIADSLPLYRIRALLDFDDVKKGDLGGYVESPANLSQEGYCWIYNEAKAYGNSKVLDNAKLYDNARICENAQILLEAKMYNCTRTYGNACITQNAQMFDNAVAAGNTRITQNAKLMDSVFITKGVIKDYAIISKNTVIDFDSIITQNCSKTPLYMASNFPYKLLITDAYIKVGCQQHSYSVWEEEGLYIIRKARQGYEDFHKSKKYLKIILTLAKAHGVSRSY